MRILFLTMVKINSIEDRGIYTDLLRKFRNEGHEICITTPTQRRNKENTALKELDNVSILKVKTLNLEKSSVLEKGLGQLLLEKQYLKAIKKYFKGIKFDLVLYSTPPITFSKVVKYVKQRDNAFTYLLLKDIFPQNAVDMGMIKKNGFLHRFFLKKEKNLYRLSDAIGCMSQANVDYVLNNNPEIDVAKVEINPNSIEPIQVRQSNSEKNDIRDKYKLPRNKKIFVYGGNLGVPQGVDFLIETIDKIHYDNVFFLIVGSGTQYKKMESWFTINKPLNAILLSALPKKDYDALLQSCDFGMIFLHKNFTIPNFPSRLLSYLEMKMPILVATDVHTDIGAIVERYNCGFWVEAGDTESQKSKINEMINMDEKGLRTMQENSWALLKNNYTVQVSYKAIIEKVSKNKA
ncbi:glycosyltransferase WbuB [Marixanthomonas ophiurae]|uniref:Glycosyltransferase WbuB n=2 Tax=Marixanthomonas ophiurae TaxID=387659 RepID=A0A3E1Q774_9FLAO|nr:glycosyltransferase WbuB [Marixanthomonas ophiurae]